MKKKLLISFFTTLALHIFAQTQPAQPVNGYGGLAATYNQITIYNHDDGATGFMLYIPASPHADSLPLVVFTHGFGEWNPLRYGSWIEHIVKRGNIVIFPRYQQNEYTTLSINFTSNTVTGIRRAIDTIQAHTAWTQPQLSKVFYVGHSYGGLISANLATKYATYNIPKPKGILMACPGYGQYPGGQLLSYSAMDSSIRVLDIIEHGDNVVDSTFALQVFNQTTAVPYSHKNLVIHFADSTGTRPITSTHGESSCVDSTYNNGDSGVVMGQADYAYTDATDFYCYWKLFDALEDCALTGNGCTTAFGDTYSQKNMGLWSNGTPITPLEVRPHAITTSVNAIANEEHLKIYPNPSNGIVNFDLNKNEEAQKCRIEIYTILGEEIYSKTSMANYSFSIDISNQPKGIYLYRLFTESGNQMASGKLVVY